MDNKVVKHTIQTITVKSSPVRRVVNTKIRGVDVDTSRFIYHETPTPSTDGSQTVFTCANGYVAGLLEVYREGLLQEKDVDYSETSASAGTFTFTTAPASDEDLRVNYIKRTA